MIRWKPFEARRLSDDSTMEIIEPENTYDIEQWILLSKASISYYPAELISLLGSCEISYLIFGKNNLHGNLLLFKVVSARQGVSGLLFALSPDNSSAQLVFLFSSREVGTGRSLYYALTEIEKYFIDIGIRNLSAYILSGKSSIIKAAKRFGMEEKCSLENYVLCVNSQGLKIEQSADLYYRSF